MSETGEQQTNNWPDQLVRYRTFLVVATHGVLFAIALLVAFLVAYNFRLFLPVGEGHETWFSDLFLPLLAIAVPVKLFVFHWMGQYSGSWRYVSIRDIYSVIWASLAGTFVFLISYFLLDMGSVWLVGEALIDRHTIRLFQSAVFLTDWAGTVAFVAAGRILIRFYYEDIQPQRSTNLTRVLIIGAGDSGEAVLRELLRMRRERYECVGVLDDDVRQLHGRIHGVSVCGRTKDIRRICEELEVQEVFIAVPHPTPKSIRALVECCEGLGVLFRTVPAVTDVLSGRVQVSRIRDIGITDLLGRAPVELDVDVIGAQLQGRRVLVTGAGGSIGSEMCRQIAEFSPAHLILVERAENPLFEIERELRQKYPALEVVVLVADVGDRLRMERLLRDEKPSIVFHAAAHKHVPMMEGNPGEAIKNNVGGTAVVANLAVEMGVEKMVMISTDKAVNPTSVMGCSKRVAEMYVQTLSAPGRTQFVTVRFGNVLGSSGSVVPIFKRQIAEGAPITVTHPDMERYFMTITEAAQLVLQAGAMGRGGEIYVLHMGDPVKIVDLARDMITLSGLRPGVDIDIIFTGIRPGEKLFEELSFVGEDIGDTAHPKIGIWKHRPGDADAIRAGVTRLTELADSATISELRTELAQLVPEYQSPESTEKPSLPAKPSPINAAHPK